MIGQQAVHQVDPVFGPGDLDMHVHAAHHVAPFDHLGFAE